MFYFFNTHTYSILFNNDLARKNFRKNHLSRNPNQLIYDTNLLDNNFSHFNTFLTNFNSSVEFAICSGIPSCEVSCHIETSLPICYLNPWIGFCMVGDFSEGYSETDCNFNFDSNVNVTVDSFNSSFHLSFSQLLK